LLSVSKDNVVNCWYSHNGERVGTYTGHQGSIWTVSISRDSNFIVTGSADNTAKLWETQTGKLLHSWSFNTAVKRVQWSEDDQYVLMVAEQRMGFPGSITIFKVDHQGTKQSSEPESVIHPKGSKATVAGWGNLNKYIIAGHENGSVSIFNWKTGELQRQVEAHKEPITDLQFSDDRTYFITSSKDKTAKIFESNTLKALKIFQTDTPLNSASLTPIQDFVILGGGQEAMDVTTTSQRQGKFECRFHHKILTDECGRVRGHFGPINTIAVHPDGKSFSSGGEDGYVRVHTFDPDYFQFRAY